MKTHTILVVDDEAPIRRVVTLVLQQSGYTVVTAADGEEACEVLRTVEVDLVLLDLRMPRMGGTTLYHLIATQWPDLADNVVIMSGAIEAHDQDAWLALHRLPVIDKPFDVPHLLAMVKAMLASQRREANGQ